MLLKDFVRETAEENRELIRVAHRLIQHWKRNPQRAIKLGSVDFGKIEQPNLQTLLDLVTVKFDTKFDRSLYNPRTKEVLIRLGNGIDIQSELIHELQHAFDDLKSQGLFRRERGGYLVRQSEVNARLTQALDDIQNALKKVGIVRMDWQNPRLRPNLEKLVHSYLKKHKLTPQQGIEQKRYQKLIKRILNYIGDKNG